MSTTISIIVPCYNHGNFLKECLNSVLSQTFVNWECIILDNGSSDNTKEVAEAFTKKDSRFIYQYTQQRGVSFARNMAISLSQGKYILPLDADDKIEPSFIEKAFHIINTNDKIKVVYSDAELFGASSGKWALPAFNLKDLLIENSIFCTALYRKSDALSFGGYNEEMKEGFEDWDFWIRMLKSGGDVYKIPETLFYYRIRASSRNNSLDNEKQLNLRRKIAENHKDVYEKYFKLHELIFYNYTLNSELKRIQNSIDYKLGHILLKPIRFIFKLFKS